MKATLDGVQLTDHDPYRCSLHHADIRLGPGGTNLQLAGEVDSTVEGKPAEGEPASCAKKLVVFPH